jgi:NAD(P)-dependent dehydrogenase (short-subunit alcohol dehydrogenase family)
MPKHSARDLEEKRALVTGAGRGIGRAIALELASMGAHVYAIGRDAARLEATRDAIAKAGGECEAIAADITSAAGMRSLEKAAQATDVLVNNAAAFAPYGALEELRDADIRRVHETIVMAPMHLCAAVLPGMKRRKFGRIVNIGSIAAATGSERQAPYTTAKSALYGLTRSVALEGARFGVTCNLVDLGLFVTERVEETIPVEITRAIIASTPMRRSGTIEEAAAAVAFLASARAGFITGAVIPVTGGLELGLFHRQEPGREETGRVEHGRKEHGRKERGS